jgi:hypothetical protein
VRLLSATGNSVLQQTVEAEVQPRHVGRGVDLFETPGRGQALAQSHLFIQYLSRTVTQTPGLYQHDTGVLVQQISQEALRGAEPWQPRFHAVEQLTVRDPREVVPGERRRLRKGLCAFDDFLGHHQLSTAEELDLIEIGNRTLARHLEGGEALDLVTEEVYTDRMVRGRAEDVNDAAPHGELPAGLDLVLAPVPGMHEPGDEILRVDLGALADDNRLDVFDPRTEPLQQCTDRGDDDTRCTP